MSTEDGPSPEAAPGIALGSPDRFGFEWATYADILPESRDQLQRWLGSLPLASMAGKTVLDAGCGMGRNSYWVAQAGAKHVTSVDVDEGSLSSARRNLGALAQVTVRRLSIYELSPETVGTFDRVMCVGVLHHLEHPTLALERLWSIVAPGGQLILWCYGKEGNELLLPAIEALRLVGSKLPIRATHALAKVVTAAAFPVFRYFPWKTEYYRNLRALSYRNIESIVFDQMLPKTARYWTRAEMTALLAPLGGAAEVERVQGNSWAARVTRPAANGANAT